MYQNKFTPVALLVGIGVLSGLGLRTISTPSRAYLSPELQKLNRMSLMNQGGGVIETATAGYEDGTVLTSKSESQDEPLVIPIQRDLAPGSEWKSVRVMPDKTVKTATLTKGLHKGCWEHFVGKGGEMWTHDGVMLDDRGTVKMERCLEP
jgi:hypothetical protein